MAILRANLSPKNKLNATLKGWLPILQSELEDLEEVLKQNALDNPLIKIENKRIKNFSDRFSAKKSSDHLENFAIASKSLFETLEAQIIPPLPFFFQAFRNFSVAKPGQINHIKSGR